MQNVAPSVMELVDAGIDWANENIPDWPEYVNRKTLNILDCDLCFLGQYWNGKYPAQSNYCGYNAAVQAFFSGNEDRAAELGFTANIFSGYSTETLNLAWQQKFDEMEPNPNHE